MTPPQRNTKTHVRSAAWLIHEGQWLQAWLPIESLAQPLPGPVQADANRS